MGHSLETLSRQTFRFVVQERDCYWKLKLKLICVRLVGEDTGKKNLLRGNE